MRKVNDRLTAKKLGEMPIERQTKLLNSRLNYYFQSNNRQKTIRVDEKHILTDIRFQFEAKAVREKLGVTEFLDFAEYQENPDMVESWLIRQSAGRDIDEDDNEYGKYRQGLLNAIESFRDTTKLPIGWFDYLMAYIALDKPPRFTDVEREPLITVENIDEYDGITLKMAKGLKSDDFATAWKALKPFFQQPSVFKPSSDSLKNKIYLDRKNGRGVSQIAKTYFTHEYEADPAAARDKVKKILSRFK